MSVRKSSLLFVAGLIASQPLLALELDIRPGKWGMNTRATMPMAPQPIDQYEEQCIAEDFDPISDMQAQMAQMGTQCEIIVTEDSSSSFMADINCPMPGMGTMSGTMNFSVDGDTANGSAVINMTMNEQTMQVTTSTQGSYLGACD